MIGSKAGKRTLVNAQSRLKTSRPASLASSFASPLLRAQARLQMSTTKIPLQLGEDQDHSFELLLLITIHPTDTENNALFCSEKEKYYKQAEYSTNPTLNAME